MAAAFLLQSNNILINMYFGIKCIISETIASSNLTVEE